MRTSEARAREIGVLDENKRSPSKKEWSAPQGRATTFYEESI